MTALRKRTPAKHLGQPRNSGSATEGEAVDLSSVDYDPTTNGIGETTRAIYVGVSGDVAVSLADTGVTLTFKAVPVGVLPVCASKIYKSGTTATNLIALF